MKELKDYSVDELIAMVSEKTATYNDTKVTSAGDVYKALYEYSHKEKEHFLLITLDGASKIINKRVIHIGTLNQSLVHPREVFRPAIEDNAAGIIISHNNPSGTLSASTADVQITARLKEASKIIGIDLLDHVIISKEGYYSFEEDGLL